MHFWLARKAISKVTAMRGVRLWILWAAGIADCVLDWAAVVYQDDPITKIRRDKDSYLQ